MVDRTDSFLREVDEDVRREQLLRLWQKYGVVIIAAIIALFAGILGYQWWKGSQKAAEEKAGASYVAASRLATEGKSDEALKAFDAIAKSAPAGYRALVQLRIAGEQAQADRMADAIATYETLSKDEAADPLMRDFAALQAAMLRVDRAGWTEMKNRLTPLLDDSRPWHPAARELLGMAAYKAGHNDEATKLFEQILGDKATPNGLSRRAQEMLTLLTDANVAKGTKAPTAAPAGDGSTSGAATGKTDASGKK